MANRRTFVVVFFLVTIHGCKERFEPNLPSLKENYLVVEGFIDANGPTTIKLSRTTPLDRNSTITPEQNAQLWVEEDRGTAFKLIATGSGLYTSSATLPISTGHKYRIRIKTSDNNEYVSKFTDVKITPPIDSISWRQENNGVQIYANTHDPQNKTRYYRWEYDETWEIRSFFFAKYIYENGLIRDVLPTDAPRDRCWKYASLSSIILGSSTRLEDDVIYLQPLKFIGRTEERIGVRYSIVVRQYALDKDGYEFYEQMKKNTESLGSIFDPQPSALRGNIECLTNQGEPVIGYVSTTTVNEKRIFIASSNLNGAGFNMFSICQPKSVKNHPDSIKLEVPGNLPYDAERFGFTIDRYWVAPGLCIDCRLRGGNNLQPAYW